MKATVGGSLLLLAVGAAPHVPFLTGGCLTDDFVHLARLADRPTLAYVFGVPDAFGFYRPVQQASYLLNGQFSGYDCSVAYRVVNLALHLGVVAAAFVLGRQLLESARGGFLAAFMFALAPKAPTIAVFWISARAELLMSLFVLLATLAWLRWSRGGHSAWLAATMGCYTMAVLSKETAFLLPVLLLMTPGPRRPLAIRLAGTGVVMTGAIAIVLRSYAPPILGLAGSVYAPEASVADALTNLWRYAARAAPAPVLVLLIVGVAVRGWARLEPAARQRRVLTMTAFGVGWFLTFIVPALPSPLRSEIRLYLPALGLAWSVAALLDAMIDTRRIPALSLVIAATLLGGYQVARSLDAWRNARFASALTSALETEPALRSSGRPVALFADDSTTERLLRETLGGYMNLVVKRALGQPGALTDPLGLPPPADALRIRCRSDGDRVILQPM